MELGLLFLPGSLVGETCLRFGEEKGTSHNAFMPQLEGTRPSDNFFCRKWRGRPRWPVGARVLDFGGKKFSNSNVNLSGWGGSPLFRYLRSIT